MAPTATPSKDQAEVILIGCGAPLRGMGWYHAVQMIGNECPHAKLCYVVEPWFMGPGGEGPGGEDFKKFQKTSEDDHGVQFLMSVADLPEVAEGVKRLALISGRTGDNPRLMGEAIKAGCTCIYLEKPGAPTVSELEAMKTAASASDVTVKMGYNKNVCKYVTKTRNFASSVEGSHVTFVSNNAYENTAESLGECFERNAEGMLKNMAIHELALLVSFYDVTVENIESVEADKEFSSMQTLKGPSGKEWTDFDKIKFTIKTKTGKAVSVQADRCGGSVSYATVTDTDGKEVFRYSMPDEEDEAMVSVLEAKYPGAMPYFFNQDPDYITVKERVANFCANGVDAEGIATIEIAVETLRVAEHLVPILQKQLS
uniref:Gfo/Idh/MocA-like oxidoreductase N-terminal domain-containing protein n=2 Tax=Attheya septentrionalis TaxID=420275 RepID=A0A7S2UJF9_9STRA|mmetsp:Transcript_25082/g.45402  ORF Transcript_25082/g.45402 Transcript_25082/m.45402 type:complete len:371 (+) Transcript_25082:103-1215(+)|eukprot:CAMPEP_0198281040 /NCGR_PEP_ID=MMETSP1449-20131203/1065_1 /TAXON_ID=420275 /ORGANISM="Attheya septentrionalis, Strain CCMP2084" /LENGTH=370 /DNA_ID=CAMNT_0043976671 /DNA_START=58 /DNA_END=1170 /DNA_ORIENTATION=-